MFKDSKPPIVRIGYGCRTCSQFLLVAAAAAAKMTGNPGFKQEDETKRNRSRLFTSLHFSQLDRLSHLARRSHCSAKVQPPELAIRRDHLATSINVHQRLRSIAATATSRALARWLAWQAVGRARRRGSHPVHRSVVRLSVRSYCFSTCSLHLRVAREVLKTYIFRTLVFCFERCRCRTHTWCPLNDPPALRFPHFL